MTLERRGIVDRIRASTFVRDVTTLVAFTTIGQAINLALAPIVSRLYSPADFGLFGIVLTFIHAVASACSLNYDSAIPTTVSRSEATALLLGNLVLSFVVSALLAGGFAALTLANIAAYGSLPLWSAAIIMAALWFAAAASSLSYWSLRNGDFLTMGQASLATNVVRVVVQLAAGSLGASWLGLALGEVAGRLAGGIRYVGRQVGLIADHAAGLTAAHVRTVFVDYRHFPLLLLPPTLADQLLQSIYMPVMTGLFGLASAGHYFFMRRVLDFPMAVVAKTIADAFHRRIAETAGAGPAAVRSFLVKVFALITVPATVAAIPVVLEGPALFAFAFGEPWREAGLYAAFAVPALVINLGVHPVSRVFSFTSRPGLRSVFTVLNGAGTIGVFLLAWAAPLTMRTTAAALGGVSFASYLAYFVSSYIAAGHLLRDARA